MGWSLSWIAMKNRTPDEVCELLGLRREPIDINAVLNRRGHHGVLLPSGWYVAVLNRHPDHPVTRPDSVSRTSAGTEVCVFQTEEHVMATEAALWRDGREIWCVGHELERGQFHLDVRGSPPPQLERLRESYKSKAASESDGEEDSTDYFYEIPYALAADVTGFEHDALLTAETGVHCDRLTFTHGRRWWWPFG